MSSCSPAKSESCSGPSGSKVVSKDAPGSKEANGVGPAAGLDELDEYYVGEDDLSWFRASLRKRLLPRIENEVDWVLAVQKYRTPFFDSYHKYWSIFGSHVCYMIGLPILYWSGFAHFARHLTFLMAFGLIVCSVLKDYLCLPRPRTPPVVRLAETHNMEFGFPSSHSVNALAAPLFAAIYYIMYHDGSLSMLEWFTVIAASLFITFSISFSRVYCGMHCPTDIMGGFAVGVVLLSLSLYYMNSIDEWIFNDDNVALYCAMVTILFLWAYPNPVYQTPSFDDSISFGFVLLGIITGTRRLGFNPIPGANYPADLPTSVVESGYMLWFLRITLGVVTILVWRMAAKGFCKLVFPPLFKYFDYESSFAKKHDQRETKEPFKFPRFNAEVATKGVVYIGIGWIACDLSGCLFHVLGML